MDPQDTASRYDRLAAWWQSQHQNSTYGIAQLGRAIRFVSEPGSALDVGCGSSGRFIDVLVQQGFQAEGLDISEEMIRLARQVHPEVTFYHADIATWVPPYPYRLICAWDSTFHLPLHLQEPVLAKLCQALDGHGVLLFTCGGGHIPGEVAGTFAEQNFEYSTLGVDAFLQILANNHCTCRHLEYDQLPENHVYVIAQKFV